MGFRNRRAYYTRCKTTGEELPRLLVITQEGYNVLLELESGVKLWEKNVRVGEKWRSVILAQITMC